MAVTEHNNIVDHFIDSTGIISWKFFSSKNDFDFSDWNFDGSTEEEFNYLVNILMEMNKEVYIADYPELGSYACRILVPNYSEIYPTEDLIWDNNNQALDYREDILNLHNLDTKDLNNLANKLEEDGHDNFRPVSELIGINFDENSPWGELVIGELKALILIATKNYDQAKEYTELFLTFNDHSFEEDPTSDYSIY